MKHSDKAALKVLEIVTNNVAAKVQNGKMAASYDELLDEVADQIEKLGADNNSENLAQHLLDIAGACVIAVASMVAGANVVEETPIEEVEEAPKQFIDVEAAAERARELMIQRARKSNIIITDTLDS